VAELAAAVADDWHGIGLGSALLAGIMQRAYDEGHSALRASVLAVNGRSIAMLRRAGFKGRPGAGMLREYELALCGSPLRIRVNPGAGAPARALAAARARSDGH
jgi:L-amino acid N-acyltransferase YncA